jgi:hypothetical protein
VTRQSDRQAPTAPPAPVPEPPAFEHVAPATEKQPSGGGLHDGSRESAEFGL